MVFLDDRFFNVFLSEVPIKLRGTSTRKIMKNKYNTISQQSIQQYTLLFMSMVDALLIILFFIISSLEVSQTVLYSTIFMVKKLVVKNWEPKCAKLRIESHTKVNIMGEHLFLSSLCIIGSQQVYTIQGRNNQLIQPEGPVLTIAIAIAYQFAVRYFLQDNI